MDPLTIAIGVLVGAGAGGSSVYLYSIAKSKQPRASFFTPSPSISPFHEVERGKAVEKPELDRAKRELKTRLLEKELLSSALTRVYEAEVEGKITRSEREALSAKYRSQIKEIDNNLGNLDVLIEVGELENLREELMKLVNNKISQIDVRLGKGKNLLAQRGIIPETPVVEEVTEEPEKAKQRTAEKSKSQREESEADKRVKALRDEVLEALARLEQMDIE